MLAAKDPHGLYPPASTLKVLTAITMMPVLNPDATVVASRRAANVEPSNVGLVPGDRYRVADLFHALLLISANDAAVALAQATGSFAKGMALINAEAHHLQAYDIVASAAERPATRQGQVVSAYDLALIARQALADARVHARRGAADGPLPAPAARDPPSPPLGNPVDPEHHARHVPGRARRQDRLDHPGRGHLHRHGPARHTSR